MKAARSSRKEEPLSASERVVDFLGDLGPRWGLPADACRVHGALYLAAKPVGESELGDTLHLD